MRQIKKLGQVFLVDRRFIEKEVNLAKLSKRDIVLEIGAGTGNLTEELAKRAKHVIAVEKDKRFSELLERKFEKLGMGNVEIINADFLNLDLSMLPRFNKVVSNIPYYISSPATLKIIKQEFELGIISYQKEFAYRLVAKPGEKNYSRISIACYFYADFEILGIIPKNAFKPMPKVDSAIVRIKPKRKIKEREIDEEKLLNFIHAIFTQKNKKLKNAIKLSRHILNFEPNFENTDKELLEKKVFQLTPEEIIEVCKAIDQ